MLFPESITWKGTIYCTIHGPRAVEAVAGQIMLYCPVCWANVREG